MNLRKSTILSAVLLFSLGTLSNAENRSGHDRIPEKLKAQVRAKVEHPFHVVKNLFGFRKVRYRGLAKNTAQLHTLFALANLVLCKGRLLAAIEA